MSNTESKITNTKFQSPIPLIIQLRNLIFGRKKPGIYTRLTFFINLMIWFLFFIWSVISYFSLSFRSFFLEEKGVDVEAIVVKRGEELGFEGIDFLHRLMTFHGVSMICWIVVFLSLVLLWRKKRTFVYLFFGANLFYFGMMIFYVGFGYFLNDTTLFDKIAFLIFNVNTLMYFLFMHQSEEEEDFKFFH